MEETRVARLRRAPTAPHPGSHEIPESGLCLSVFLVLEAPGRPGEVLLGQIDPSAPWATLGALDPGRLARIGERWMLPSRHLRFYEGPDEAARDILARQLASPGVALDGPRVFSEPSPPNAGADAHWDLHFVYRGRWPTATPPRAPAWKRLEFVNVAQTSRAAFARGGGDVLELVGLRPKD